MSSAARQTLLAAVLAVGGAAGAAVRHPARGAGLVGTRPAPRRAAPLAVATELPRSFELDPVEAEYRRLRREAGLYPHKVEVLTHLEPFVESKLDILKTVEESWQPQDFLPDMTQPDWVERVTALRKECAELPDEVLIAVVGDTVTEEALPTYQTLLNTFEGMDDPTGTSLSPWARWSRGWTAEENRHGDALNKFLFCSGRVDMRVMEVTVQNLIRDGFNPRGEKDPYRGIIYTSFQERATKISHQNVARLCGEHGAKTLAMLTTRIAGDEARCATRAGAGRGGRAAARARARRRRGARHRARARTAAGAPRARASRAPRRAPRRARALRRHEMAYQTFMKEIFRLDPSNAMISFADMMKAQITMPAELMTDGHNGALFADFSDVAQQIGVYTAVDYARIICARARGRVRGEGARREDVRGVPAGPGDPNPPRAHTLCSALLCARLGAAHSPHGPRVVRRARPASSPRPAPAPCARRAAPRRARAAYLVEEFGVEGMTGLTPEAQAAQEAVCALPPRYLKLAERSMRKLKQQPVQHLHEKFKWLVPRS